nr:transposase [Pseudonocardia sp. HH130630-07]
MTSRGRFVVRRRWLFRYWLQVLTEIKNRGVADACIVVCDGLKTGQTIFAIGGHATR